MVAVLAVAAAATFSATGQGDGGQPADNAGGTSSQLQPPGGNGTGDAGNAGTPSDDGLSDQPLNRIGQLFFYAPVINGLILGLSVLALMFFVMFMLKINNRAMAPPALVDEVVKLVIRGDYERAADVCRRSRGVFVADIVQRCVENATQQHAVMLDMIDAEGRRQADILWNRVSYLADISNVAPMLGLLGTVLGMIDVFAELEITSGSITAQLLAGGVGKAMATTMFGLSVGILSVVLYSVVKSRATRSLADAEQAVHMIADHIKRDDTALPSSRS
jgi:biopolymer transport protein ExbB